MKSGNDTEFRESIRLLGGRVYPIRLGVLQGQARREGRQEGPRSAPPPRQPSPCSGNRPGRPSTSSPSASSPGKGPQILVLQTAFPADDQSVGYERGTSISKAWDQATTDAALEVADYVAAHLGELAGVKDGAGDREAKVRDFCRKFAGRAFRRPLSDEQKSFYLDRQFKAAKSPDAAARRVVLLVLKSAEVLVP